MKIEPTENRILVRIKELKDSTLHIPDAARVNPYGEVLAVGPGVEGIEVADKVLFLPSAQPIGLEQDGEEVFVIPAASIFAKYV